MLKRIKNKKVCLLIICSIIVMTFILVLLSSEIKDDTHIELTLDKAIEKNQLKILISPYRKIQCGYESPQRFDELHQFVVIFNEGQMQDYHQQGIREAPDYYIYAKYKNQYARVKYKNTQRLGQGKTEIKLSLDSNSMNGIAFNNKLAFRKNEYDMQLLNHLDQL